MNTDDKDKVKLEFVFPEQNIRDQFFEQTPASERSEDNSHCITSVFLPENIKNEKLEDDIKSEEEKFYCEELVDNDADKTIFDVDNTSEVTTTTANYSGNITDTSKLENESRRSDTAAAEAIPNLLFKESGTPNDKKSSLSNPMSKNQEKNVKSHYESDASDCSSDISKSDSCDASYHPSECESDDDILGNDGMDETNSATAASATSPSWANNCEGMNDFKFCGTPGLKLSNFGIQSPYEFFCLFANDDFYELLVRETNHQARELFQNSKTNHSRINSWKDLTVSELKVFLGLLFHMGHIQLHQFSDYWKKDELYNLTCFSNHMSRNRFLLIIKCLHFCRNPNSEKVAANKLHKVKPLLDHFNSVMDAIYYPCRELSIDEPMILWGGCLVFPQYVTNKKHKYGRKLYQLTEPTGMVLRTLVYSGVLDDTVKKGQTDNAVLKLMESKLHKGHALYMDHCYNSYHLSSFLIEKQTFCTGILRIDRKDNPSDVLKAELKDGERKCQYSDGVQVTKWRKKSRDMLVISNEHEDKMVDVTNRRNLIVRKPLALAQYSKFICGIHRKDQMMAYYPCERKILPWYLKIGIHLIHTMMLNSFYLFHKYSSDKVTFYDFRISVVRELLSIPSPLSVLHVVPQMQLMDIMHIPSKLQINARGRTRRKRCRECFEEGRRKETMYCCDKCPKRPALCVEKCFEKYHAKKMNLGT